MIDRFLSPRGYNQPFLWIGEYDDNTNITEFEDSGVENHFNSIEKDKLKKFGLLGRGHKLSFNVKDGIFDIYGNRIEFWLECNAGELVPLTSQDMRYDDIITYKCVRAVSSTITPNSEECKFNESSIVGYFFGYKNNFISPGGMEINSKIIFALPMNDEMRFGVRLVLNKSIKGEIAIIINGEISGKLPIETVENEAVELEWVLN